MEELKIVRVNFLEKLPQLEDLMNIHAPIIIEYHKKMLNKYRLWLEDQFLTDQLRNLQELQWIAQVRTEILILKVTASPEIH